MSSHVEITLDAQASTVTLSMRVDAPPEKVADDLRTMLDTSPSFVWYGDGADRLMFRASAVTCVQIKGRQEAATR